MNLTINYMKKHRIGGTVNPPGGRVFQTLGPGSLSSSFTGTAIVECSGLAYSRIHTNIVYVHNDSGNPNTIFMVNVTTGATAATLTLSGATNVDWEDIAYYNGDIYVADIGDNNNNRTNKCIYKFPEPSTISTQTIAATKYPISYTTSGTNPNAEAFMIRPSDGTTFIATKANAGVAWVGIWQGPTADSLSTGGTNAYVQLTGITPPPGQTTAGDWAEEGNYYMLSTNAGDTSVNPFVDTGGGIYIYDDTFTEVGRFPGNPSNVGVQPSEAACWSKDGNWIYRSYDGGGTAGEGIFKYAVTYGTDPGGGGETAVHSQQALRRIGTNIQPGDKNYNMAKVEEFLVDMGIRLIRYRMFGDNLSGNGKNAFMRRMWTDHGIKWHATCGVWIPESAGGSEADRIAEEGNLDSEILLSAAALEGLGGYNEPNGSRLGTPPSDWALKVKRHQQWLSGRKAAHPTQLADVAITGPSLHDHPQPHNGGVGGDTQLQQDYLDLAPCAPFMEHIEMHRYPNGGVPSAGIDQRAGWATAGVGTDKLPVSATESGYHTTPIHVSRVSELAQGIYIPRLVAEHLSRGNKVMQFEYFNQFDSTGSDRESWLGIIAAPTNNIADLTPMIAYHGLKRLFGHLEDGDAAFTTTPLDVVYGGNPGVFTYLTQKRDGTYRLLFWRDVKVWDQGNNVDLSVAPVSFILNFPTSRTVTYYTPRIGTAGTTLVGTKITIPVEGDLMVVKI